MDKDTIVDILTEYYNTKKTELNKPVLTVTMKFLETYKILGYDIEQFCASYPRIFKMLNDYERAAATKQKIMYGLISIFDKCNAEAKEAAVAKLKEYKKEMNDKYNKSEPTDKEEEAILNKWTLDKLRKVLSDTVPKYNQKELYFYLMTFPDQTPRLELRNLRFTTRIGDTKETGNWLYVNDGKVYMVLNKYKTYNKYGQWKYQLPADAYQYLSIYIDKNGLQSGDYMFLSARKNLMRSNKFSKWAQLAMKTYTDDEIRNRTIRKIKLQKLVWGNPKFSRLDNETQEKMIKNLFRNSFSTARHYYRKV